MKLRSAPEMASSSFDDFPHRSLSRAGFKRAEVTTEKTIARVLLVEDSEDDAYFFQRTLRKAGLHCTVDHIVNGSKAIQYLANASPLPDLIFLDLKMPVVSGFDVLHWIGKSNLSHLKVYVLSGSNDTLDRNRCHELGAADYLVKPVTAEQLRKRIEEAQFAETNGKVSNS